MSAKSEPKRTQIGPFWLWYRADRDDWRICWYDDGAGTRGRSTRRKSTGIGGGDPNNPPPKAEDALADHYAAWRKPVAEPNEQASVENLIADWLLEHVDPNLNDPGRYAASVVHWLRFFENQRKAGFLTGGPVVSDIKNALVDRFVEMRRSEGVTAHTISRDIAALRQALNWNWKNERIAAAPFIADVKGKAPPRELVYTPAQVAALLEAAMSSPEREHVHLYTMIALSTHGRSEAILELDAGQVQGGLIYFNAPGRVQSKKRRSIVPIAPTLAPWLKDRTG
jgi:integrase